LSDRRERQQEQKKRTNFFCATLAAAMLAIVEGFIGKQQADTQETNSNREIAEWTNVVGNWTKRLAYLSGFTVVILSLQFCSFIENESAQLFVSEIGFDTVILDPDKRPTFLEVTIKNTGKSTAFLTRTVVAGRIDSTLPDVPDYGYTDLAKGPVAPGQPYYIFVYSPDGLPFPLNAETIREVIERKTKLFIFGFIQYWDRLFRFTVTYKFCFMYDQRRTLVAVHAGMFSRCISSQYQ
jgi:hypothetical protein